MRGSTALALAVVAGIGGVVAVSTTDTLDGLTSDPDPNATVGEDGDAADEARASSDVDENATDVEENASEDVEETVDANETSTNATPANNTRDLSNATLTLDGPEQVEAGAQANLSGRLSLEAEGLAGEPVDLRVDGELALEVRTNATGRYAAKLSFSEPGNRTVQAVLANASETAEVASEPIHVLVEEAEEEAYDALPAPEPGEGWPMLAGDQARSAARTTDGPGGGGHVWTLETHLDVRSSPAVAGDLVYVGTSGSAACCDPTLYAANASTGEIVWNATREGDFGSPVVHERHLLVPAESHLVAYDALNGTELWAEAADFPPSQETPTLDAERVYTVENPSESSTAVVARDLETGATAWERPLGGEPETSPVVDGRLYVGVGDTLYALDVTTGDVVWSFEGRETLVASPALANGTVYTATSDGAVYAVDAESGEQAWWNTVSGSPGESLSTDGESVYVGAGWGYLYVFDAADGSSYVLNQTVAKGADIVGAPAAIDGTVYMTTREGEALAVDAENGDDLWSFTVAGHEQEYLRASPAVVDGRMYVAIEDDCDSCRDTGLYVLDAGTATED